MLDILLHFPMHILQLSCILGTDRQKLLTKFLNFNAILLEFYGKILLFFLVLLDL